MRDNVEIMTDVFKNAMTFERYAKTWADALAYIDSLLASNKSKTDNALSGIENEQYIINNIDSTYAVYKSNAKKDMRKSRRKGLTILVTTLLVLAVSGIFYYFGMSSGNTALGAIGGIVLMFLTMTIVPVIILAIIVSNLYKAHVRKKDVQKFSSQNSSQKKIVAANNIKSYNSFLEKTKKEKTYLLSKRQTVMSEYNEAKGVLNQIYGTGLIPERYQGLVETATIYGYLYNGICTSIRGHGGVYERYENDLQHGEIIGALNAINQKLNIVIKNQNKLYEEMCAINSSLSDIKSEIAYGNKALEDIRKNSAITATASAQSAAANSYVANAVWRNS